MGVCLTGVITIEMVISRRANHSNKKWTWIFLFLTFFVWYFDSINMRMKYMLFMGNLNLSYSVSLLICQSSSKFYPRGKQVKKFFDKSKKIFLKNSQIQKKPHQNPPQKNSKIPKVFDRVFKLVRPSVLFCINFSTLNPWPCACAH